MVFALTVISALVVAFGEVVQQRWAAQAPAQYNLSPRLLWWLVRQPRWLVGVGISFGGNAVFTAALSTGGVVLIEAVFVVRLVFALLIAAVWGRHRVPLREAFGAVAITAGLVAFLLAGHPEQGDVSGVPDLRWMVGGGGIVAVAAVLSVIGARSRPVPKAALLGAGTGVLYGVQGPLMQTAIRTATAVGVLALAVSWSGYAVIVVAVLGMLFVQSAFGAASLEASYPAVVTGQLLSAIAVGTGVLGGRLRLDPVSLAVFVPALVLMVAGIYLLSSSPIVTGTRAAAGHH